MKYPKLYTFIRLLRVHHWIKNFFILMPVFFGARLTHPDLHRPLLFAFFGFSLVASAVYIFNDMIDAPADRLHPRKKNRPLAAGQISLPLAGSIAVISGTGGLLLVQNAGMEALLITFLYLLMNVVYSVWLKKVALIDVVIIAIGFLMRIYLGGAAANVEVSSWLTVLTFLLALILGFAKRRGEYIDMGEARVIRKSQEGYNLEFLNAAITICSTVAIVAYLMYCFSTEVTQRIGSNKIYFTALFVILGILRYLQLAFVYGRTASPTRLLLEDRFLQLVILVWIGAFAYLLY